MIRIFDASGSPYGTTIQSRAQGPWAKPLTVAGNLDGSFDEPPIHLRLDEPLPKSYQGAFTEWRLLRVQTIQYQLLASIHQRRLNDLII